MRQIERRLSKLEAQAAVSAKAKSSIDIKKLCDFLTLPEMEELKRIWGELGVDHPTAHEIRLRSTTRRERYPLLWQGLHPHRSGHPKIPQPWSVEAEIQALRDDVALMWEQRGLALDLDALTPDDLTVLDALQPKRTAGLAYWDLVKRIATPPEIEAVLAKVLFVSRSIERDESGETIAWEDLERPLNWHDLHLDPATFPWEEWRKAGKAPSSWRRWSMES